MSLFFDILSLASLEIPNVQLDMQIYSSERLKQGIVR